MGLYISMDAEWRETSPLHGRGVVTGPSRRFAWRLALMLWSPA